MREKLLFVCQRYGLEVNGGAETECRLYAERLAPDYDVEVLTTCAVDHVTWRNHYPAGVSELNGVKVRRFPVERERGADFLPLSDLVQRAHSDEDERRWLESQGPYCPALPDYLAANGKGCRAVFFMTYLYYPTVLGMKTDCGTKILIPTAHDEWSIYLRLFRDAFAAADRLLYNSEAERRLVERLFPHTRRTPCAVAGAGVEAPGEPLPDVKERFGLDSPYLCYCGRIEPAKGCAEMLNFFRRYKRKYPGPLKLVLTGKAAMDIPKRRDIVPLGFVSEAEKFAVMQGARFLIQPSRLESLSIVTLESMLMGRPVLVNGKCEVLRDHCIAGNAGLYYNDYYEFEACVDYLLTHEREYRALCRNSRDYVARRYAWEPVMSQVRSLL